MGRNSLEVESINFSRKHLDNALQIIIGSSNNVQQTVQTAKNILKFSKPHKHHSYSSTDTKTEMKKKNLTLSKFTIVKFYLKCITSQPEIFSLFFTSSEDQLIFVKTVLHLITTNTTNKKFNEELFCALNSMIYNPNTRSQIMEIIKEISSR